MEIVSKFTKDAAMEIVEVTVSTHRYMCEMMGIFDTYKEKQNFQGNIGGVSEKESQDHFLVRFLNSAARTQLPLVSEDDSLSSINEQISAQLLSGEIYVVDIAAGNGAGVISMINTIAMHRKGGILPVDLLDIRIHAIDFSLTSLSYYEQQLSMLQAHYASVGINTYFQAHIVDITNDQALESEITNIKRSVSEDPRFLLVCSAISGVKKDAFKRTYSSSYKIIANSFRGANSSFLWVEPRHKGRWIRDEALAINFAEDEDKEVEKSKEMCEASMSFCWIDPHQEIEGVISTGAEYYLLELAA